MISAFTGKSVNDGRQAGALAVLVSPAFFARIMPALLKSPPHPISPGLQIICVI
jgi:hypothetical protein